MYSPILHESDGGRFRLVTVIWLIPALLSKVFYDSTFENVMSVIHFLILHCCILDATNKAIYVKDWPFWLEIL